MHTFKTRNGFTLMDGVISFLMVAIVLGAFLIAIHPIRLIHEWRNSNRWNHVASLLDGLVRYREDHGKQDFQSVAALPIGRYYMIGTCATDGSLGCAAQTTEPMCVDLSSIGKDYLAEMPFDPVSGNLAKTGYYVRKDGNGILSVGACNPEKVDSQTEPPFIELSR